MVVINCYRPPGCSPANFRGAIEALSHLQEALPTPTPDIVFCGDFNFPFIRWPEGILAGALHADKVQAEQLLHFTNSMFLTQVITKPTRGNNILDLFFINNRDTLTSFTTEKTIFSDHNLIVITTNYKKVGSPAEAAILPKRNPFSKFNFFSCNINWEAVNSSLSNTNWEILLQDGDPNDMLDSLLNVIHRICIKNIPERSPSSRKNKNIIPKDRKILMRRRASINQQIKKTTNEQRKRALHEKVSAIESQIIVSHEKQRSEEEIQAMRNIKNNPKYFFSYCKKFSKAKTKVGPLQAANGELSRSPQETCNILSQQYTRVFSKPRNAKTIQNPQDFFAVHSYNDPNLGDVQFTADDIQKAISELRVNSAAGPDGVPAILLIKCKETLAFPLHRIWRRSLETGIIPSKLKDAIISPIYKGGDRNQAKNYRPVALTSHLIKIFEKILREHIIAYLEKHQLISNSQHGFRKGRSCLSNLLHHYEWLLQGLASGGNVDIVYLDFAKAFDRVDHGILTHKLKALGITGKLGAWLHNFLTERTQVVAVDGHKSEKTAVISGVPQGSVLGPLLFLVLMNDISQTVDKSFLSSFADDTTLSHRINSEADIRELQSNINKITEWAEVNNMQFNEDKFEMLRCGPDSHLKTSTALHTGGGKIISQSPMVKCLGIHLSEDATYKHHIHKISNKAKQMAGWALRTFRSRDQELMLTLWKALIQPILDYCSQLWSPLKKGEIQEIESVPRYFTRQIAGMQDLNYWERLEKLGLYSQQRRRERYQAIYVWKILEQQVPNPTTSSLQETQTDRNGRKCVRRSLPTSAPERIKTLLAASFTYNGPRIFNSLPKHIREITSCPVNNFKIHLDKFLKALPDKPPVPGYTAHCRAASNSIPDQIDLLREDSRTGSSSGPPQL